MWRDEVRHWQAFCAAEGTENTLIVRYEDLVNSAAEVVGEIFSFLDEPYVDTVSTYAQSSLSRNLASQAPWHSSLRKGISTAKVGVYKRAFTPREIEIVESIQGDDLRAYGYTTEYDEPRPATARDKFYAFFVDRLVRWYRKLYHPRLFRRDIQFRFRIAWRLLLGGWRPSARAE